MLIRKLSLNNFRNYKNQAIEFEKGVNIILGENGSGKTNVVEAIHYLSLTQSFRNVEDKILIKNNTDFAKINALLEFENFSKNIEIVINKDKKVIQIDSKKAKKTSELTSFINVIAFKPSDVNLFIDSPSERRRFLNIAISKNNSIYLQKLIIYEKLLKERNELLKLEKVNMQHLDVLTSQIMDVAIFITRERARYVKQLNKILEIVTPKIFGCDKKLKLIYKPFISELDSNMHYSAGKAFKDSLENDLKRKQTNIGPHREDFSVELNGRDISKFGSQGENRLAVLSLVLSPYYLIDDEDKKPIIILDDVFSELDDSHQENLISCINEFTQVFITATNMEITDATYFNVANQTVTRRKS